MRKARYDMRQVVCRNSSCIGFSSNIARPGYWVTFGTPDAVTGSTPYRSIGRVLGRIAETDRDGVNCAGFLAVVRLTMEGTHAAVTWVPPAHVIACYEKPPAALLAWLTGDEWVKSKDDIARIVAMSEHGTLSESYIGNRDNPEQSYNARPEYINQFILR